MYIPHPKQIFAAVLVAVLSIAPALRADPGNKPDLTCTADRSRSIRIKGGDWDDKTEKIQFDIAIRNNSMRKPTDQLNATFFVIGEDAGERNNFKLLQKEDLSFSLEASGTHEATTPQLTLKWDNTGAIFGEKYRGWVLQVRDDAGEIVSEAASASFLRSTAHLADMDVGDYLEKSGEPKDGE